MSNEESKNDAVQEARELLANAAHGPLELIRYDHGGGRLIKDVDDNGQLQRDLIADFYDAGNREFYSRAREIVSALCAEVEELRRRNETQADSIMEFQEEHKSFKELLRNCLPYVLSSAEASRMMDGFEPREHAEDSLAQRMFDAIGDEELRDRLTPLVVKKLREKRTN